MSIFHLPQLSSLIEYCPEQISSCYGCLNRRLHKTKNRFDTSCHLSRRHAITSLYSFHGVPDIIGTSLWAINYLIRCTIEEESCRIMSFPVQRRRRHGPRKAAQAKGKRRFRPINSTPASRRVLNITMAISPFYWPSSIFLTFSPAPSHYLPTTRVLFSISRLITVISGRPRAQTDLFRGCAIDKNIYASPRARWNIGEV